MPRKRKKPPPKAAIVSPHSDNRKTGPVAVTYAAQKTCPDSCRLKGGGCYAEGGPIGLITARLNAGAAGKSPLEISREEAALIRATPACTDMRLHGVGDARTANAARTLAGASEEYMDRGAGMRDGGVKVWTYTHAHEKVPRESWGLVSVLASCHSPGEVVDAMDRGYAACTIVAEWDDCEVYESVGLNTVPCPYQTKGVQCIKCRLCLDDKKLLNAKVVIVFKAHGNKRESVLKSLPVLS